MKLTHLIAGACILFSSCRALTASSDQPEFAGTHWKLIAMNQKAIQPTDQAFIEFSGDKASGKSACNSFTATVEQKRNKLSFTGFTSTKMFCDGLMDEENTILTNLQKVNRFEIRYGLLYLYESNNLVLTYKK